MGERTKETLKWGKREKRNWSEGWKEEGGGTDTNFYEHKPQTAQKWDVAVNLLLDNKHLQTSWPKNNNHLFWSQICSLGRVWLHAVSWGSLREVTVTRRLAHWCLETDAGCWLSRGTPTQSPSVCSLHFLTASLLRFDQGLLILKGKGIRPTYLDRKGNRVCKHALNHYTEQNRLKILGNADEVYFISSQNLKQCSGDCWLSSHSFHVSPLPSSKAQGLWLQGGQCSLERRE